MRVEEETERPTDIEIAMFYARHIENPCVEPTTGENIRPFWLNQAQEALKAMNDNLYAKTFLQKIIKKYS